MMMMRLLLLVLALPTLAHAEQQHSVTILHGVTIINPASKTERPHMSIVLDRGRIGEVSPSKSLKKPAGAKVIDLRGRYVLPGFVDMHAHVLLSPRAESGEILPKPDAVATRQLLAALLAAGITTVRDPGAPTAAAIQLRDKVKREELVGPRIITAGNVLNSTAVGPEFVAVTSEAEVCAEIERQRAAGVDVVKVYSGLRAELIAAAIGCAHKAGLKIVGHIFDWTEAANLHIDGLEHAAPWSAQISCDGPENGHYFGAFRASPLVTEPGT